jgi:hypothetical protein
MAAPRGESADPRALRLTGSRAFPAGPHFAVLDAGF